MREEDHLTRWSPDARRRLQDAALQLFAERGYSETTVAAVAEHAGLTERTFFRHFDDKKEVLFDENHLAELVAAETAASDGPAAVEMAADGFRAVAAQLQVEPARVRRRALVIAASPELQERELIKLTRWTAAVTRALEAERVEPRAARIAAEVSTAIFRIAYGMWLEATDHVDLVDTLDALLEVLRSVVDTVPRGSDAAGPGERDGQPMSR